MAVVLMADVLPAGFGGFYIVFAVIQAIFLLVAVERIRRPAGLPNSVKDSMPKWQKIVIAVITVYAFLLFFVGVLTKQ
jgi:Na+/melibiose symporter-like transporter